jgi:hypothetical protein
MWLGREADVRAMRAVILPTLLFLRGAGGSLRSARAAILSEGEQTRSNVCVLSLTPASISPGRSIFPTEKHRISQKEPFYMSAKRHELTASTLTLAGITRHDVDRIAADVAAADAAAAAAAAAADAKHNAGKSRRATSPKRRHGGTIQFGDATHYHAAAAAAAGLTESSKSKLGLLDEDDGGGDKEGARRTAVAWLGRTGETVVDLFGGDGDAGGGCGGDGGCNSQCALNFVKY